MNNKNKPTIIDAEPDTCQVMTFSDDDNRRSNNSNGNGGNNAGQPKNKGYIRLLLIAVCFLTVVGLMLYFFVFQSSSNVRTFSENAIFYNIDADSDGKYDELPGEYKYDSGSTIWELTDQDNAGELAQILLHPSKTKDDDANPYKNVVLGVTASYQNENIIYLTGTYIYQVSGQQQKSYSFRCTITQDDYNTYVKPIIQYVQIEAKDANNQIVKIAYYSYDNQTLSSLAIESTSDVSSWLVPLALIIVIVIVMYFFYSRMSKGAGGGMGGNPMAGFVNNVARKQNGSKIRFSDVAGCDEAKAELVEMVDYFHSTEKYTRLGAKLPHGVLLVGPPGTGKTLLAKAVAGEANVPFYSISGSDFVEMYVGVGASRVRSLFKTAKQNAPCLIFIDEIDAVGRQRGTGLGGGNDEREQTLNELLVEMDGFEDNNGVIVMAATNRSDVLDPALTRPGRFDRTITVDLPDKNGRAAILKVHSRNKKLAADVSFDNIAQRTVGFSGADLANIMNDAAILAVRANRSAITTSDIDEAIDRAISGPAKKSHLEPAERKQVAYHEAGHAVIGIFLPYSDKVQKITIIPRGRTGGHVLMTPEKDRFLMTKNQLLARITGYLGGRTSEEIFFGDVSTGASNDIEVATNIARSMVTEYGMSELGPIQYEKPGGSVFLGRDYNSTQANYSTQIAFEIDKAIRSIVDSCHEEARKLLEEHRDDVTLIAETLIENETITADQIEYLLKNRKLPEVDEHKIKTNGKEPKNPNNIVLYPGYQPFYEQMDQVLEGNPSKIILIVSTADGGSVDDDKFAAACAKGAKDPSKIGLYFVDSEHAGLISVSVESFGEHLESYVGKDIPMLLVKTDEKTLKHLQDKYQGSKTEVKTDEEKPTEVVFEPKEEKNDDVSNVENEPNDSENQQK